MSAPQPPQPASKHWSGVAAGETFLLTLNFDESKYTKPSVQVKMRRNATTGFTESAEEAWSWSVASKFGEGEEKAKACKDPPCMCKAPAAAPAPAAAKGGTAAGKEEGEVVGSAGSRTGTALANAAFYGVSSEKLPTMGEKLPREPPSTYLPNVGSVGGRSTTPP
jgi:hypothetical protein